IETTGLADPAPILHTLVNDPLAFAKFQLDGVIATVDAVNGTATLDAYEEAVKQAAMADRILLTKTDLAGDTKDLRSRLAALNPGATVIEVQQGQVDPSAILDLGPFKGETKPERVQAWLNAEAYQHEHHHGHHHDHADVNRHDAHIRAFCFVWNKPIAQMRLNFFTQLLSMLRGPDLLRVKGLVRVLERPDQPAVIHGVQHVFHPVTWLDAWPGADRRTRIVFIVRNIEPKQIEELMASLTEDSQADAEANHATT
ncbi:MAG: GTP-binding protein, partial [Rhodobacteraceae bacterium]|nr:GTP-binding protein [Paracoccaceae bacterium]